jgi:hypothetical protein
MLHHVVSLVSLAAVQGFSTAAEPNKVAALDEGDALASAEIAATPIAGRAEDEGPLFPLPFTPDFTRGGGWGFAVGVGVEYENAYDGSDEYEFEVDPALAVQ